MVGSGRLEKLIEVIGTLPRLALEVTLGGGNELLIGIVSLLVVVTLIIAGSNCDLLRAPLLPLFVALGTFLSTFAGCFGRCRLAAARVHFPIAWKADHVGFRTRFQTLASFVLLVALKSDGSPV